MLGVAGDEAAIERATFGFQHAHGHRNARLAQPLDASSVDFCKRIDAANDASPHTFAHDEVGTRRRFAMV